MIALLTPDSMRSPDVANELATRRESGRWLIYLCARGVKPAEVGKRRWRSFALDASDSGQLHKLLEDVAGRFGKTLEKASPYVDLVNDLASAATSLTARVDESGNDTLLDRLSEEAVTLLTDARTSQTEEIRWQGIMAGLLIYIDGRKYFEPENKRSEAIWRSAVNELELEGLIEEYQPNSMSGRGSGRVFNLTPRGYDIAESVLAQRSDKDAMVKLRHEAIGR